VQRDAAGQTGDDSAPTGEATAQAVEHALLQEGAPPPAGGGTAVDAEALADRVYHRLIDHVLLTRERASWLG
jgi:hypothetical protein